MTRDDPNAFAASVEREQHPPAEDAPLAGRGERLSARVLDNVIALGVYIPGLVIALGMTLRGEASSDDILPVPLLWALSLGVFASLGVIIFQWYLVATTGQTIGKRVFKLRVVKADGRPVGFVDGVILREWVTGLLSAVPFVGFAVWIVDPLMIFGADRRCLHDVIATTKVIRVGPPPESAAWRAG